MPAVHLAIDLPADADAVWAVVRDLGAVERFAPGFVVATELDGDDRLVTFANGVVAREAIIDVDDARRRLAYAVVDSPLGLRHHSASFEAVPTGGTTTLRWTADVLPAEGAELVAGMMAQGAVAIRAAFN
jgi:hypothetical protein